MPTEVEYRLNLTGTQWRRPGFSPLAAATSFVAFEPKTVKPLSRFDSAEGERNVGYRAALASDLEVVTSDISLTGGSHIEGVDLRGKLTGGSPTAVVRDSLIRGPIGSSSNTWAARGGGSGTFQGALFEWVTFDLTGRESAFTNVLEGGGFVAQYCEVLRGVDGHQNNALGAFEWYASRFAAGNYFAWWNKVANAVRTATFTDFGGTVRSAPFPSQSSGDVHADGLQIIMGGPHKVVGCNIGAPRPYTAAQTNHLDPTVEADYLIMQAMNATLGFANTAIIFNTTGSNPITCDVDGNWVGGGTATINVGAANGSENFSGVTIRNNRFYRQPAGVGIYPILVGAGASPTITNNVYDDTGAAVPVTYL